MSAGLMVGCGVSMEATPLNVPPHPMGARPVESVEVYSSAPPAKAHIDVSLLRADQVNYAQVNTSGLIRALLAQAAKMGCDAIVVGGATERAGARPGDGWALLDPGSHGLSATCIAYVPGVSSASTTTCNGPVVK